MLGRICALSVALGAGSSAFAADLPSHSPAPAPEAPALYSPVRVANWTGFYVGDAVGVDLFGDSLLARSVAAPATNFYKANLNGAGFTFGSFVGYNQQVSDHFVLGVEGSFGSEWMVMRTSTFNAIVPAQTPPNGAARITEWVNSQGSVRLRAGYDVGGNVLVYGTGGFAGAVITRKFASLPTSTGLNLYSGWKPGWTLGLGVDYKFAANWFARLEYRYSRFYNVVDTPVSNLMFTGDKLTHSLSSNLIQVGVGYQFGAPAEPAVVAAKY